MSVAFYFDPACPWTWLTSRWLAREAERNGFDITWRSFSLAYVNRDRDIPEKRPTLAAAASAHRMFERLRATEGGNAAVAAFYGALGRASHSVGQPLSPDILKSVAAGQALGADVLAAADDASLDAAIVAQTEEALALCGGDAGSPVLSIREGHGFNGPIIDALPSIVQGQRLWEAVVALSGIPAFFEVKRARTGPPPRPPL